MLAFAICFSFDLIKFQIGTSELLIIFSLGIPNLLLFTVWIITLNYIVKYLILENKVDLYIKISFFSGTLLFALTIIFGLIVPIFKWRIFSDLWENNRLLIIILSIIAIAALLIYVQIKLGIYIGNKLSKEAGLILGIILVILLPLIFMGIPIIIYSNPKRENNSGRSPA